ncbi:shikimate kinase [Desulfurivibrio alkaliphilus]|uniref:Shikimate kinase n=1 Tax=Desulfurivibrio alkaliphilus (strain DSM 19089 / UNIQEM U267 / AHT2) TaxID=589865 RepID=D6Z5M6_DESAT|nr:shikimate kinase [Desulfurivibrio alkaliphilus]ADH86763.1 Shikimate kinase [Desulfurivibrio alkaliphilus AHT 2]
MLYESAGRSKIFLIGYRACGKSVVGQELAVRLGYEFLDMDREITRREGVSIKELVAARGWDYFRRRERELLLELSSPPAPGPAPDTPGLVVATGGGAVLQEDLWPAIKAAWPVVWLTADAATITARLSGDSSSEQQRPALTDQGLLAEVEEILQQRLKLYRQAAGLEIDTTTAKPAEIVDRIIDWLQEQS